MINFKQYPQLTRFVIPNSVKPLYFSDTFDNVFSGMNNLRSVSLPDDRIFTLKNTFNRCVNLTQAVCGYKVDDMSNAYYGCKSLTTAVCGPNVRVMASKYCN